MLASLQIDDTQAFTLDTNIIARLAGEFRHFLDQPRLGLFNVFGLFTSTSNFVTHSGLGKKIDPLLQGRESHLAFVSFFRLTLTPTLHDKRWELFDLEFGNSISLALLNKAEFDSTLEHSLTGEGLENSWRFGLVGEEQHLGLGCVSCEPSVNVVFGEDRGEVRHHFGYPSRHGLGFHFAFIEVSWHRICRVHHDSRGCLHVVLLTENWPVITTDCTNFCHAFQLCRDSVVLIQKLFVLWRIFEEPKGRYGAVTEFANDSIKISRRNLLDVMFHGVNGYGTMSTANDQQTGSDSQHRGKRNAATPDQKFPKSAQ